MLSGLALGLALLTRPTYLYIRVRGAGDWRVLLGARSPWRTPRRARHRDRRAGGARCRGFTARYRRNGEADFRGAVYRRIDDDGAPMRHRIGARLPLELYAEGTLKIEPDCDSGAPLRLHEARLTSGRFATFYRLRYLAQPPMPGVIDPRQP